MDGSSYLSPACCCRAMDDGSDMYLYAICGCVRYSYCAKNQNQNCIVNNKILLYYYWILFSTIINNQYRTLTNGKYVFHRKTIDKCLKTLLKYWKNCLKLLISLLQCCNVVSCMLCVLFRLVCRCSRHNKKMFVLNVRLNTSKYYTILFDIL